MSKNQSNQPIINLKVCARIRPIEYTSDMIHLDNNKVIIKDTTHKTNVEKQIFEFNKVWDSKIQQEDVCQYVYNNTVEKILRGGNSCIISYGQTGSGKSYSIFGEHEKYTIDYIKSYAEVNKKDKRGLIPKITEYLFNKGKQPDNPLNVEISCSFAEIYLDQVRDLGKAYNLDKIEKGSAMFKTQSSISSKKPLTRGNITQITEQENLEISELPTGEMAIKDLTVINIKNIDELYEFIAAAFRLRYQLELARNIQLSNRAHTIFTLYFTQRDTENDNIPLSRGTVQFIDLAGSEKIMKSISEGQQKYQEAILIANGLSTLSKVLLGIVSNSRTIPYRESRLTKALYNTLSHTSYMLLLIHIHPAEANFEEALATLQYADRCRNIDLKEKKFLLSATSELSQSLVISTATIANDRIVKKLETEIADLKKKIENINKENKTKFDRVKHLLGVEIDFDKVISHNDSKDALTLRELRQTKEENDNLHVIIKDLEEKIEKNEETIQNMQQDFYSKQNKFITEIVKLKEELKREKELKNASQSKIEDTYKRQIQELKNEIKVITENSNSELKEKLAVITNLPSERKIMNDSYSRPGSGKVEPETQYKKDVTKIKSEYTTIAESLKAQYEKLLETKNNDLEKFSHAAKEYNTKKKIQIKQMKEEMLEMFYIIQKYNSLIEKIETGGYTNGIRSCQIPSRDKPAVVTRTKFECLYKHLDKMRISTMPKPKENISQEEPLKNKEPNSIPSTEIKKNNFKTEESHKIDKSAINSIGSKQDDEHFPVDMNVILDKLDYGDLLSYCENLRYHYKKLLDKQDELKKNSDKYLEIKAIGDINEIIKERDRYKLLFKEEQKKNNDNRIALESQKRLLQNATHFNSSGKIEKVLIRPSTGHNITKNQDGNQKNVSASQSNLKLK